MSICRHFGCLSKESVQVRGSHESIVTCLFFMVRGRYPTPYPQAGGPPRVVCP
jgi:hypothetical protein